MQLVVVQLLQLNMGGTFVPWFVAISSQTFGMVNHGLLDSVRLLRHRYVDPIGGAAGTIACIRKQQSA
jgi:hypothetical protein